MNLTQNLRLDASALRSTNVGFMQGSVLLTPSNQLQWNPFQPQNQQYAIDIQASWISFVKRYKREDDWTAKIKWQVPSDPNRQHQAFFNFGKGAEGEVGHKNRELFCQLVNSVLVGANAAGSLPPQIGQSSSHRPTPVNTHAPTASASATASRKRAMSLVGIATDTPSAPTSAAAMEGRAQLLVDDKRLKELQNQLVESNVVTRDQFWEGRDALVDLSVARKAQEFGTTSSFGLEVPKLEQREKVTFSITKEIMKQIFFECPPVHTAYVANVPEKMSEESFWTMYFHSKYFHRERTPEDAATTGTGPESKATQEMDSAFLERQRSEANAEKLFGFEGDRNDDMDEAQQRQRARKQLDQVDAEINLVATDNDMPVRTANNNPNSEARGSAGVWERDPAAARQDKLMRETLRRKRARGIPVDANALHELAVRPIAPEPVVNKYNRHGTRVLATQADTSKTTPSQAATAAARKRRLTKEDEDPIAFDLTRFDRETATREGYSKLNLKALNQFDGIGGGGGGTTAGATAGQSQDAGTNILEQQEAAASKARQIASVNSLMTWRRGVEDVFPDRATTMAVLKDLAENTTAAATERLKLHGQSSKRMQDLDPDFRETLLRLFNAACELCRHFWAAAKRRDGLNKMERVHEKMLELITNIHKERTEIRNLGKGAEAMILLSVIEQLQCATDALVVRRKKANSTGSASASNTPVRSNKKVAVGASPSFGSQ